MVNIPAAPTARSEPYSTRERLMSMFMQHAAALTRDGAAPMDTIAAMMRRSGR